MTQFADIVPSIRGHHEAWNGSGYPDGLQGKKIPFYARIIAIADTIDAMTTDRPYREAMQPDVVRAELVAETGRQFDPEIAGALVRGDGWGRMVRAIAAFKPGLAVSRPVNTYVPPRHSAVVAGQSAT